jgi:predicted transcriptional regulator YdeE
MDLKIVNLDQIILAGVSFFGDPFETSNVWMAENQIGRLWQRWMAYLENLQPEVGSVINKDVGYEVHIRGEETEKTGFYEVFVGMEVLEVEKVPVELLIKVLPKSTYAVLTLHGSQIMADWDDEIGQWLKQNKYQAAFPFMFQYYDERFKGMDLIEESEIDFYVPIKKES